MVHRFLTDHAERRIANGRMKRRTVADYDSQCRAVILPALGAMPVAARSRRCDIEAMVDPLKPVMRNRILALTSRIFTLAEHWDWRPQRTNPARGIERSVETARDRVLSPAEYETLAGALADRAEHNPAAVAAIRLAALTGLRIGEVLAVQWEHVDHDTGALLLPDTKTGRRWHDLPAAALAVLGAIPRINAWCFTNGRTAISYKHTAAVFRDVAAAAGLDNVRLHDLRRTVATRAAASGLGILELRALLGWKTTAMPARYVALSGDGIREHRRRIGDEVAALDGGRPTTKRLSRCAVRKRGRPLRIRSASAMGEARAARRITSAPSMPSRRTGRVSGNWPTNAGCGHYGGGTHCDTWRPSPWRRNRGDSRIRKRRTKGVLGRTSRGRFWPFKDAFCTMARASIGPFGTVYATGLF